MSQDLIGTILPNIEFENIDINEYSSGGGKVLSLQVTFSILENISKEDLTWSSLPPDLLENIKINIVGFINEPEVVNEFEIYSILDISEEKKISSDLKKIGTKISLNNFNTKNFEIIEKNGKRYKKLINTILFETFPEEVVTNLSFMSYCYYDFNNLNEKDIFGKINIVKLIENGKTTQRKISYFEVVSGLEFFGNPIELNDERLVSYTDRNVELQKKEIPISILTDYRIKKSLSKSFLNNLQQQTEVQEEKKEGYFSNIFLSTTLSGENFGTLDDLSLNGYFFFDYEKFSRDNFKFKNVIDEDLKMFSFKLILFAEENKEQILLDKIIIKKVPFTTESPEIVSDTKNLFLINFKSDKIFKKLRGNYKIKVVTTAEDRTIKELVKNYLNLIQFNGFLKTYINNFDSFNFTMKEILEEEKINLKNFRTEILKSVKSINKTETNILEQDSLGDVINELFEGVFKDKIEMKQLLELQDIIRSIISTYEKYLGKEITTSIVTTSKNNIGYRHFVNYEHIFNEEIKENEFNKILSYRKNQNNKAIVSSNQEIKEFFVEDYQKILNSDTDVLELLKNNINIIQYYNDLLSTEKKFTSESAIFALISSLEFLKNKDFIFNKSDLPTNINLSKDKQELFKELIYLNLVFNVSYETKYLKSFKVKDGKVLLKKEIWTSEQPPNVTLIKNEKFKLPLNISEIYKNSFILQSLNLNIIDEYLAEI
jgi:hypothetical protein